MDIPISVKRFKITDSPPTNISHEQETRKQEQAIAIPAQVSAQSARPIQMSASGFNPQFVDLDPGKILKRRATKRQVDSQVKVQEKPKPKHTGFDWRLVLALAGAGALLILNAQSGIAPPIAGGTQSIASDKFPDFPSQSS